MKKTLLSFGALALTVALQGQITLTNDINPGAGGCAPTYIQELNGKVLFGAEDGISGVELWSYDPSTGLSQIVYNIGPGTTSGVSTVGTGNNGGAFVLNGKLYFVGNDQVHGFELWMYDGTNTPTMVADINPGAAHSYPYNFVALNNKLYFSATSATLGAELFVYDPVLATAQIISDINPGAGDSYPGKKYAFDNKIHFNAYTSTGGELHVYDPSDNSITNIDGIQLGSGTDGAAGRVVVNGTMYLIAYVPLHGFQLHSYAGSGVPTRLTNLDNPSGNEFDFEDPVFFNGKIYFSGNDGSTGFELYSLDLTTNVTSLVSDIEAGAVGSSPGSFCVYFGKLYFRAYTAAFGEEVWSYDGVNAPEMVQDLHTGVYTSYPDYFREVGGKLYFSAWHATHGTELFYYQDTHFSITEYNNNVNTVAYPVPAQDEVHIRVTLDETVSFSVNVYDITGKTVYTLPTTDYMMGTVEINIPLQSLAKGSYQYALIGAKGMMGTGKIIKQ